MKKFICAFFCCKTHRNVEMSKLHNKSEHQTNTGVSNIVQHDMAFTRVRSAEPTRPVSLPNRRRQLWVDVTESPRSAPSAYSSDYRVFIEYPKDTVDAVYVNYEKLN